MIAGGRMLTIDEVAEIMRGARSTLTEKARRGQIPNWRAPGARRVLVPEEWLEQWIANPGIRLEVMRLPKGGRIVRPAK